MTKKDFIAMANVLKDNKPNNGESLAIWQNMVVDFADMAKRDNPNFKYSVFYAACGMDYKIVEKQ